MSRKLNIVDYTWIPLMVNGTLLMIFFSLFVYNYTDTPTMAQIGTMSTSTHTALRSTNTAS
jgi:hypothetical protein